MVSLITRQLVAFKPVGFIYELLKFLGGGGALMMGNLHEFYYALLKIYVHKPSIKHLLSKLIRIEYF